MRLTCLIFIFCLLMFYKCWSVFCTKFILANDYCTIGLWIITVHTWHLCPALFFFVFFTSSWIFILQDAASFFPSSRKKRRKKVSGDEEGRSIFRQYSLLRHSDADERSSSFICSAFILAQKISYSPIGVLPQRKQRQSAGLDVEVFTWILIHV